MKKGAVENCGRCGKGVREAGIRGEGAGNQRILCKKCLKSIYPEGKDLPVTMDMDGNLYFIDKPRNVVMVFFGYGNIPYSSCTEISLEEDEYCGCGFNLY
ncbi:MAG: hypothetical protein LBQ00_01955 [Syntrophobacterales bacterium]|jgi:hypothetical protein|nr:hypothetical protein [Syntrophobacterales bacterium]